MSLGLDELNLKKKNFSKMYLSNCQFYLIWAIVQKFLWSLGVFIY